MTHKTKDCLERPRKKGAKYTGKNIAADEVVQHVDLGFEAKRDRWNGYDASEQLEAVKEVNNQKSSEIISENIVGAGGGKEKGNEDKAGA